MGVELKFGATGLALLPPIRQVTDLDVLPPIRQVTDLDVLRALYEGVKMAQSLAEFRDLYAALTR